MNNEVPYMPSVANLHKVLDAIQRAAAPETFHLDFLKDLGFTSSNDRGAVKLLKFLGFLDGSGRPQTAYREFMDQSKAKHVLAKQLRLAYDDLFKADLKANEKSVEHLKGWFKTKTGSGDAVAKKIATTFKSLCQYADFSQASHSEQPAPPPVDQSTEKPRPAELQADGREGIINGGNGRAGNGFGLVYRFEIHLPDTQNVDTFRAIFKALREELM